MATKLFLEKKMTKYISSHTISNSDSSVTYSLTEERAGDDKARNNLIVTMSSGFSRNSLSVDARIPINAEVLEWFVKVYNENRESFLDGDELKEFKKTTFDLYDPVHNWDYKKHGQGYEKVEHHFNLKYHGENVEINIYLFDDKKNGYIKIYDDYDPESPQEINLFYMKDGKIDWKDSAINWSNPENGTSLQFINEVQKQVNKFLKDNKNDT